jgi:uncharacterized membrane protein
MSQIDDVTAGGTKSNVQLIYILYLVSIAVGITGIVGVVMAFIGKDNAPDWLKTHYRFLIRTFFIGLIMIVIGFVLAIVLIGIFILLFSTIWLVVRCIQGMNYLGKNEPIPRPDALFFL